MKRIFCTTLLLGMLLATATAQYFPVDTARLNDAFRTLINGERTLETEMKFLEAYPTTWLEFYMTYSYIDDENFDYSISNMCTEHLTTLIGLSHISDTVLCKKIIDLTIGMKENCECTSVYQDYLIGYILGHEDLVFCYLSKLRKGHQMQFWEFCWSTVTECNREEHFKDLYSRNKDKFPVELEISRIAFEYFYDGINYPALFPHKREEYERKFNNRNFRYNFNDYRK